MSAIGGVLIRPGARGSSPGQADRWIVDRDTPAVDLEDFRIDTCTPRNGGIWTGRVGASLKWRNKSGAEWHFNKGKEHVTTIGKPQLFSDIPVLLTHKLFDQRARTPV